MAYLMIVDDDEDFANAVASSLRIAGHEVAVELETAGAARSMEARPPDLAIIDVMFPENISVGFELARAMRHHSERLKDVPIVMLTGVNRLFPFEFGPSDIDGESLPVTDFLEKPVDLDVLRDKVSALLKAPGRRKGTSCHERTVDHGQNDPAC